MKIVLPSSSTKVRAMNQGNEEQNNPSDKGPAPAPSFHRPMGPPNRAPPRRIDHTYRDYSKFPLAELPSGKKAPTNFPSKLHQILSTPEYSHIISWMPHGRAWKIHNKELLVRDVIPQYFVQSKYESFTRQLNGWGFKRLHQSGNDFNAYYHETFLRGLPHLVVLMKRVAPNQGKLLPHVEGEPNFYEIDKQFPLPPPMMPYQGHYYSPPHMAGASYGAPPEPTAGYNQSPSNYSSYPVTYPPPPQAYYGHGDPQLAAAYTSQPGYPPYPPYYAPQYGHPPNEPYHHYPYPPGPTYSAPYGSSQPNNGGPVKSEEVPLAPAPQGVIPLQEESNPIKDEQKEDSFEPLSYTEIATTESLSSGHNSGTKSQR